ncbi:mechanosensitive ion channel domain-containing protein [Candidatus Latescibacterota bacterium]
MNNDSIEKMIVSVLALFVIIVLVQIIKFYTKKTQKRLNLKMSRYLALRRFITLFSTILYIILLGIIWGIDINNLWISLTGFVAMIAIAFFAIWSLIGNILAGLILFFTSPFKIDDTIEILPDEIKGRVLAINTFYTLLIDENDNFINVPNSLLFQKYIKKIISKA